MESVKTFNDECDAEFRRMSVKAQLIKNPIDRERLLKIINELKDNIEKQIETIEGKWEDVYDVVKGVDDIITDDMRNLFGTVIGQQKTVYYQTYAGGPEGGYFVLTLPTGQCIYEVNRTWGTSFTFKEIPGKFEFEDEDESISVPIYAHGRRCRVY
jgi:hypothetical protein